MLRLLETRAQVAFLPVSSHELLAQFGLTPKSRRGLIASDPGEVLDLLDAL